jgi:acyl-CoA hydrolase
VIPIAVGDSLRVRVSVVSFGDSLRVRVSVVSFRDVTGSAGQG